MPRRWTVTTLLGIVSLGLLIAVSGGYSATAAARHKYALADDSGTTTSGSAPVNASLPRISGEARQGTMLSASNGSWDNSPDSYSYQWRRCGSGGGNCSNIPGATSNAYVLRAADVSHTIRVVVTASNSLGSSSATSARTAVVLSETALPAGWKWNGSGCENPKMSGATLIVCNYGDGAPFLITGSSNGAGTVKWEIHCQKYGVIRKKVLLSRSKKVKGAFKMRGIRKAATVGKRCTSHEDALVVKLTGYGSLNMKIDYRLPWGK